MTNKYVVEKRSGFVPHKMTVLVIWLLTECNTERISGQERIDLILQEMSIVILCFTVNGMFNKLEAFPLVIKQSAITYQHALYVKNYAFILRNSFLQKIIPYQMLCGLPPVLFLICARDY